MNKFDDLMIDVECFGMPPDGALVSIGCVFFDLKNERLGPTFYRKIHLATAVRDGGKIDAATTLWWMRQPDTARHEIAFGGEDIRDVLQALSDWIKETCRHEDVRPWANSPNFDLSIIGGAYKRAGIKTPWHYSKERDFRSIRHNYPKVEYDPSKKGDGAHNALTDAIFQAEHLFAIKRWAVEQRRLAYERGLAEGLAERGSV